MRRALIACGGTGGHLSPGIALAEELMARGWDCELLISNKQVDSRLVNKYSNFKYVSVPGSGLSFSPRKFFKFASDLMSGIRLCSERIRSMRPDVVIGFGGFLSASALLAGAFFRTTVAIHEANRVPGRVTRLVSWFADRLYLPNGVSLSWGRSARVRPMGMPVRSEIVRIPREEAKRALGFDGDKKLLLVFGGSQGARSLNDWAEASMESLAEDEIQLLCLTGIGGGEDNELELSSKNGSIVRARFMGFSDQMGLMLSAADLTVSRSGAGSIAEMERCESPAILVPFPYAADNHQYFNAKRFEAEGGGFIVENEALGELLEKVRETITDEAALERCASNLKRLGRETAQAAMAEDLEAILLERNKGRGQKGDRRFR